MKIKTARFGDIDVEEGKIITCPEGLIGFNMSRRFVILSIEKFKPFLWLQSLDDGNLCFVMTDPWLFIPDYAPELSDEDVTFLGIDDPASVALYTLISFEKATTRFNLLAPLCINHKTNTAKQIILNTPSYSTAHPLTGETLQKTSATLARPSEAKFSMQTQIMAAKILVK
jgi:flagellar assembly factor FliW